ncbi:MAG TPA: hypothetical protein VNC21_10570 [Vicinamibacterales bacterium]|nr:hypothetical protein [Vicinamibacterales bacterium]
MFQVVIVLGIVGLILVVLAVWYLISLATLWIVGRLFPLSGKKRRD